MSLQELQSLLKLGSLVQWLAVILVFVAGALQISKCAIDRKAEAIREEMARHSAVEYEQTISDLKERIDDQIERMQVVSEMQQARGIPKNLIPRLTNELSKYGGSSVRLNCPRKEKEARAFCEELKSLFQEANWSVNGVNEVAYAAPVYDIVIVLKDSGQKDKANYIFSIFKALKYPCTARLNKNQPEDITILVGKRS